MSMRVLSAVLLVMVAGCGGIEDEPGSLTEELGPCPNCDVGEVNANGVVNVEGGQSCIDTNDGPACPVAVNNSPGGVLLIMTDLAGVRYPPATLSATYGSVNVALTSITATRTEVVVGYTLHGQSYMRSGAELVGFVFSAPFGGNVIKLRFTDDALTPVQQVDGVYEHKMTIRVDNGAWQYLCYDDAGAQETASLVQGAYIDPLTAERTVNSSLSMLGCKKGGITSCMEWGYKPWELRWNGNWFESLIHAHLSCIQMKRAAYCGTSSYTKNGTPVFIDDRYGIQPGVGARLEAVWTPAGATCLNTANRRHLDIPFPGCPNQLNACPTQESLWWGSGGLVANGIYSN